MCNDRPNRLITLINQNNNSLSESGFIGRVLAEWLIQFCFFLNERRVYSATNCDSFLFTRPEEVSIVACFFLYRPPLDSSSYFLLGAITHSTTCCPSLDSRRVVRSIFVLSAFVRLFCRFLSAAEVKPRPRNAPATRRARAFLFWEKPKRGVKRQETLGETR